MALLKNNIFVYLKLSNNNTCYAFYDNRQFFFVYKWKSSQKRNQLAKIMGSTKWLAQKKETKYIT